MSVRGLVLKTILGAGLIFHGLAGITTAEMNAVDKTMKSDIPCNQNSRTVYYNDKGGLPFQVTYDCKDNPIRIEIKYPDNTSRQLVTINGKLMEVPRDNPYVIAEVPKNWSGFQPVKDNEPSTNYAQR